VNRHEAIRRTIVLDRLDSIVADVERWKDDAWEFGVIDEATRWFELAATVRAAAQLTRPPTAKDNGS
jgi:hypothetical protein